MELTNRILLIVFLSSLILSFSGEAYGSRPSPSKFASPPAPVISYISSTPDDAPDSSPAYAPAVSYISYAPSPSSDPAPAVSYISYAPMNAPASSPSNGPMVDLDILVLLQKSIRNGIHIAEEGIKRAQQLSGDPSPPSTVKMCLHQCIENLDYARDDLKKALGHIATADNFLVSEDLAAASSDAAACDQCFVEMMGGNHPIAEFDDAITSTSTDSLSILLDYASG
ncbi:uncharacterized protein LOC130791901 [Actinidia eriantha]|uniref:uncharacterized protein LOC130791901 n=1 Tax=Actinidia eriantha TaxID=165200 RepID=UPI00258DCBD3|nr:uncharacterized protein LOC130791901 [Actinidia eriantha]